MKILDIKRPEDLTKIKDAILNNEEFKLGEITPLTYKITVKGGRFTDYDINYIDSDIAKIVLSYQQNYTKLLTRIEKKFKIKFNDQDKILKFHLQKGSLEFISELLNLGVLKDMESIHQVYVILGLAGTWFGYNGYIKNLENEVKKIDAEKEIKLKELDGKEREDYNKTMNNTITTFKEVMMDKQLQNAVNEPKKAILSLLKDDENLKIETETLKGEDSKRFDTHEVKVEDIEDPEVEETHTIETYNFHKEGKLFKIVGQSTLANSLALDPEKRMKLIEKAESGQAVTLKMKYFKDGITKKIKNIIILDLIS